MNLEKLRLKFSNSVTFKFGDNPDLCNRILVLVRSGEKVATCESLRAFEENGDPMPVVGRQDIALNWDGSPALVIETVSVDIVNFCDVQEDFALAEGEDKTLASWCAGHKTYFERNGGFEPDMPLVCERFRLVRDLFNL